PCGGSRMTQPNNAVTATVVFEDAEGAATDPDAGTSIIWRIYNRHRKLLESETQALADATKTATGTYTYDYTPPLSLAGAGFWIEAHATVGGKPQSAWAWTDVELP
ncbi:MAG TPA: hypothetical protein VF167_09705, partial [Longimicrobiaceae bacterium]